MSAPWAISNNYSSIWASGHGRPVKLVHHLSASRQAAVAARGPFPNTRKKYQLVVGMVADVSIKVTYNGEENKQHEVKCS